MMITRSRQPVCYLQRGEDGGGDDDEKPEVHVEELTDHIGHVGWENQQEQTQRYCSEVLPKTPEGQKNEGREEEIICLICTDMGILFSNSKKKAPIGLKI